MFRRRKKIDPKTVLRAIKPYPAVFVPNNFGGTDVFLPNFPGGPVGGLNFETARLAAVEYLTLELSRAFQEGRLPPPPSDPDSLQPDEEEVLGTRVLMIDPDLEVLTRRLGLRKTHLRTAPTGEKYEP